MGGYITVESEEGIGSTFIFYIEYNPSQDDELLLIDG
jgi:signal transduction histidine kinase